MKTALLAIGLTVAGLAIPSGVDAREAIRLASAPALSPDGKQLAFSWRGNIWLVSSEGGVARQWSTHPSRDIKPRFSPNGQQLAFTSDRSGTWQVYVGGVSGGFPTRLTFNSEGSVAEGWFPDGEAVLISGARDHFWRHPERFFRVSTAKRLGEELLFDAEGHEAALSPDGKQVLFVREDVAWWRKGYYGSQAGQIWLYDAPSKQFTKLVDHQRGARSPLWLPDGKSFYYVGAQSGSFNLWRRPIAGGKEEQITHFDDDSVVMPCIARDGATLVFRHLFDLYRYRPADKAAPRCLDLFCDSDIPVEPLVRRTLQAATEVSFTPDGLELAMIAGGDLWVMDTELREPRQITHTPEEERSPAFAPDGKSILYVSSSGGQTDIWRATRSDPKKYWWQNDRFVLTRVTDDAATESDLQFSPRGDKLAFVKGRGDLWLMDADGKNAHRVLESWDHPSYDWAPDGRWLTYAVYDADFNRDVWVVNLEGPPAPVNLSCHPNNDSNPAWSPDGKIIAFLGRRQGTEVDIYFVYLQKEEDEADAHDRAVDRAIDKLRKGRLKHELIEAAKTQAAKGEPPKSEPGAPAAHPAAAGSKTRIVSSKSVTRRPPSTPPKVRIDLDRIADRIHQVPIPNASEGGLFWSPDSKKLAFTATIDGKPGIYTISPPDDLKPKLFAAHTGHSARWLEQDNRIVWLSSGTPGSVNSAGDAFAYRFAVAQQIDVASRHRAAFDICWRTMRDYYYDARMNHRNWDEIHRKYGPLARLTTNAEELGEVVNMMLGELNGSHLGFYPAEEKPPAADAVHTLVAPTNHRWKDTTAHLGVRFDPTFRGPGCKVQDVIAGSPADRVKTKLVRGDVILSVDGKSVSPSMDLTDVLNGPPQREVRLRVRNPQGADRDVELRPISYEKARALLYDQWTQQNRQKVTEASQGKLGYLHIRSMDMPSFYQFERDLYAVGAAKDGLIIDVRENGGGSTTDHLLTALTQPVHAITVPRGGQPGYPQDRKVYATWNKPICVLCNQNSFSNAEIFSHAIKTLKRGPLVGVPTAGGVLSTGHIDVMDLGRLRVPGRGWYLLSSGADMELNGAMPDYLIWPQPGDWPRGRDEQLSKAIEVLRADVAKWSQRPQPTLRNAADQR